VAAVVAAEVDRALAKCGLAEVVQRLQAAQVGVWAAAELLYRLKGRRAAFC
jgi:hypothetical protein